MEIQKYYGRRNGPTDGPTDGPTKGPTDGPTDGPMHYGAAVKWGQQWPTLTNYFSVDVDPKIQKKIHIAPSTPQLRKYIQIWNTYI